MFSKQIKYLITILLFFVGSFSFKTQAQSVSNLSDEQIASFIQQAQASGLSEAQLEAAATAKGFSTSDIAAMRDRIANMKKGNRTTNKATDTKRQQMGEAAVDSSQSTFVEEKNVPKKDIEKQKMLARIYGMDIFQNKRLSFEPNLRLPTPKNYILGTDDELSVNISGYATQNYTLKVSNEGTVRIENLSPIFVSGSTIEQARERIINRLKAIVPGLNTGNSSVDVTLGNVRSIKVMIIGEVERPGTYTVSSLATAFNALYACGGISQNGTLREIEVYRYGKIIRKIDIYDFLARGDKKDDIPLFDQDIIRVPYYETHVELEGEVKSPLIFEVKKGETFKTVLDFAGGFSDNAYAKSVSVIRITPTERRITSISQNEFGTFRPERGDKFVIGKVLERFENRVVISGAIFRPGNYELEKDFTLTKLIKKAEGLREDAFLSRIIIKRERENLDPEIVTADLAKILKNELPDITLNREDSIFIKSYTELRERRTITIEGAINRGGTFDYAENMNVGDLITMAGGFSDGAASSKIDIARRIKDVNADPKSGKTVETFSIGINRDLSLSNEEAKVTLQPFDKLIIRRLPLYEEQKTVSISGEVVYAGPYTLKDKKERIADLIDKAGGMKSEADLKAARFTRDRRIVAIDITEVLKNRDIESNLLLVAGDALEIPRKKETVTIMGQVMNPITVAYESKLKFQDYIDNAGGFTDSAKVGKIFVRYANGSISKTKRFLFIPTFPKVEQGMEIIVPKKRRSTPISIAERIAIGTGMASLGTSIILLLNYLKK